MITLRLPYMCYFYNTDYRGKSLPCYQDERYQDKSGEVCEVIALTSPDENTALTLKYGIAVKPKYR